MEGLDQRSGHRLPPVQPFGRGPASYLGFDGIDCRDPLQRLLGDGGAVRLGNLVEFPPRMRPAGRQDHAALVSELLEPGIAVDLKDALEGVEMCLRPDRPAVGLVDVEGCRRIGARPAPLVAGVDPQPAGLGAPAPGIEHRQRRVVGEQLIGREDRLPQSVVQRFEPPAGTADPAGHGGPLQIDALAGEDLGLAVQGEMIAVLADQDVGEQRGAGRAAGDHPLGRGGLHHRIAPPAGILGPPNADDPQGRRHPVEHLADALADGMQGAAATGADVGLDIEHTILPSEMVGKRLAPCGNRWGIGRRRHGTAPDDFGEVGIEVLQAKRQLVRIEPLGTAPELATLQLLDDALKAADLVVTMLDEAGHLAHQAV